MSVQGALQFIQMVRQDEMLKSKVQEMGTEINMRALVSMGAETGLTFTPEELQAAHKHDWAMRWLRYHVQKSE